jgi:hypothetical protein
MPTSRAATSHRRLLRTLHAIAGGVALVTIATFLGATLATELAGSVPAVVTVKALIPWGLLVLIPALAITGGTGFALDRGSGRAAAKARRMRIIAANGLLLLVPAAFFLAMKAGAGELDLAFYSVQAVEILAGTVNLVLIICNARDGFTLSHQRSRALRA